jgi:ribosome recycling factor
MAEPTAAPAGHNFKNVKDVENAAKARMDKSIADMQHTIAGIRTGRASVSVFDNSLGERFRRHSRGLLRLAYADQPGR